MTLLQPLFCGTWGSSSSRMPPLSFPLLLFLILWGSFSPSPLPIWFPSSLRIPLLLFLFPLQYLFSPYLSMQLAPFASLTRSEESPTKSCSVRAGKHGLPFPPSLPLHRSLNPPHLLSQAMLLFFVHGLSPFWVSPPPPRFLLSLKCSGGTNKERQKEAKLRSQWQEREAERVLETKSRNSASALQTERERMEKWGKCRHTH